MVLSGQALVDDKHQVVVHAETFGTVSDHEHVAPLMAGAKENMKAIGHDEELPTITARAI